MEIGKNLYPRLLSAVGKCRSEETIISVIEQLEGMPSATRKSTSGATTISHACELLKVSKPTFFRLKKSGFIRCVRLGNGRGIRVPLDEIERFLQAQ